ncbi:MAG: aldo/keto reductase [Chloroflexi bacterium]|nr:aldo/keto reductase [Chloroflexota bacterium]
MRYRTFGRTGLRVSTVSMGANRLGDPGVDPTVWPPIVERALALGVNFFDTSISYNQGRSEAILGEITQAHAEPTLISTKVGFNIDFELGPDSQRRDYSARAILRDVDGQLVRLRRDSIDMYLLHSPKIAELEAQDWATAIDQLKRTGKIHWFGISTSDHASGIWAIEHGADVLQIEYDMLSPSAEQQLLPLAQRHNVGIMVRTPLARGLLTGKFAVGRPIPPDQQWRRPTGEALQTRLRRIEQLRFLERPGQTLTQAALRFVLAHPAVHCAVPGARTMEQLETNVPASDGDLTHDELAQIRRLQHEWRAEDTRRPAGARS